MNYQLRRMETAEMRFLRAIPGFRMTDQTLHEDMTEDM
jgi:hypothetical protein